LLLTPEFEVPIAGLTTSLAKTTADLARSILSPALNPPTSWHIIMEVSPSVRGCSVLELPTSVPF